MHLWWFLASIHTLKTVDCRNFGKNAGKGGKLPIWHFTGLGKGRKTQK